MIKKALVIAPARYRDWFVKFREEFDSGDVKLLFADSLESLTRIFEANEIDIVFMGGSSGWEERLEILQQVLTVSPASSVHCKGENDNGEWFIKSILNGFGWLGKS